MADLNWCTYCDSAISQTSNSLYCSEQCLRSDALLCHPLLGYKYPEFKHFPRRTGFMNDKQFGGEKISSSNYNCKLATTDSNMTTNVFAPSPYQSKSCKINQANKNCR